MEILIKLLDNNQILPNFQTPNSVGLDLAAQADLIIPARQIAKVPLGVAIKLPTGFWGLLAARSSLYKKGLMLANGIGVVDPDYCGDKDQYIALLLNFSDQSATIQKGERIVQLVLVPTQPFEIKSVLSLNSPSRGGFGSTGLN
jgi:dUTP pyrophosphatase